ncbi:MAG: ribbon-helix-helix protein, CopG family [Pseudonocardiaceae bacterium]
MAKRMTVQLDDALHRQVTDAAGRTERSVHSWILAAVSREVFRQLTAESAAWCAAHPEHADHDTARHAARRAHRRSSGAA